MSLICPSQKSTSEMWPAATLALVASLSVVATSEARSVLETVGTLYPNTPAAMIAMAEKSSLGDPAPVVSPE